MYALCGTKYSRDTYTYVCLIGTKYLRVTCICMYVCQTCGTYAIYETPQMYAICACLGRVPYMYALCLIHAH